MKNSIRNMALSGLMASALLLSATSADAACADQSILYGQTVNGSLSTTDCTDFDVTGDTYYADYYQFTGTAGDKIYIQQSSSSIDPWLMLIFPSGDYTSDDDGGGGTTARIPATSGYYTLTESGTYLLEATSAISNTTGSYTLSLVKEGSTATLPSAPTNVTATAGNGSATVTFTPGSIGSGTLVTYWAACGIDTTHLIKATGSSSPITVTGLTNGTVYYCWALTESTVGYSSNWSTVSNTVTPTSATSILPSAPTNVTATAGDGSATVTFTPGSIGSGTLVDYWAACDTVGDTVIGNSLYGHAVSLPITVTGLTNGTAYSCGGLTRSTVGDSAWSARANPVTPSATPSASASVVEFYNTTLDNYFMTADSGEASAIDNGSAGAGWIRTGNIFSTNGSTPVCRFYGSQSPGPNSHFYTADAGECAGLKQLQASTPSTQKRWNYEGIAFNSTTPANGTCPSGTVPVYRAYNNGSTRGVDSNHRITSNLTAIQQQAACGWSSEGVVMCAASGTSSGGATSCGGGTGTISFDPSNTDTKVSGTYQISGGKSINFSSKYLGTEKAEASYKVIGGTDSVDIKIDSRATGTIVVNGASMTGYGALTNANSTALSKIASGDIGQALAMIPLEIGCKNNSIDTAVLAALVMPLQMFIKYQTPDTHSFMKQYLAKTSCKYFSEAGVDSDSRPSPQSLVVYEDYFPNVFYYFPFDEVGSASSSAAEADLILSSFISGLSDISIYGKDQITKRFRQTTFDPTLTRSVGKLFGPCGSRCRGACGADCPDTCNKTLTVECVKDNNGTNTGEQTTFENYECGAHSGCEYHDSCYEDCFTKHGCGTFRSMVCMHNTINGCDTVAGYNFGYLSCWSQSKGNGPYDKILNFKYATVVEENITACPVVATQIESLSPSEGAVGTIVTITGTGFGVMQGTVTFNGTTATVSSWSDTNITTTVPTGATTGNVVVKNHVTAVASNGVIFTVNTGTMSCNDISGSWSTDWGSLTLTQSGSSITGNYTHDSGKIDGVISGTTISGRWSESPSYSGPQDAGLFVWSLSTDCKSFSGTWGYDTNSAGAGSWTGTKN